MARVLIVGANRGIGLELVRNYANRGDSVFALCRKPSSELSAIKNTTVLEGFDVSTDSIIGKLMESTELPDNLDVVIVNAGILIRTNFDSLSSTEAIISQFNINSVGVFKSFLYILQSNLHIEHKPWKIDSLLT